MNLTGTHDDQVQHSRSPMQAAGVDRMAALHTAFDAVRRGGTVSIAGVYGGAMDPFR